MKLKTFRQLRAVGAGLALATMGMGCGQAQTAPEATWKHYSAELIDGTTPSHSETWVKGTDAVHRVFSEGKLVYDERCEGKISTVRFFDPITPDNKPAYTSKFTQSNPSAEACLSFATKQEFALWQMGASGELKGGEEMVYEGRKALRFTDGVGAATVLDVQTHLPLYREVGPSNDRATMRLNFTVIAANDGPPVAAPEVKWTSNVSILAQTPEESAASLKLAALPKEIAGLAYRESLVDSSPPALLHSAIWGKDDHIVSIISNTAMTTPEQRGFNAERTEWNTQEGELHVKVYAPDPASLIEALKVLRPEALLAAD